MKTAAARERSTLYNQVVSRHVLFGCLFGILFPLAATLVESLRTGTPLTDFVNLHLHTPLLWIIDSAPLVLGFFGGVIGTWQARVEELNRMNRSRLMESVLVQEAILEGAGYIIIATDVEGRITTFNPQAERLTGFNAGDIVGIRHIHSFLLHEEMRQVVDNMGLLGHAARSLKDELRLLAALSSRSNELREAEIHLIGKDNRRVPVRLSVSAYKNDRNEVRGYILMGRDLTELRSAENLLEENERRSRLFLEALPVGIYIMDAQGKSNFANAYAEALLGKGIQPGMTQNDLAPVYQAYRSGTDELYPTEDLPIVRALNGEYAHVDDMELHREDGVFRIEVWAAPVRDSSGKVAFSIAAFMDITRKMQAETTLRRLASIVEQSEDGIVGLSRDGNVESWNQGARSIFGFESREILGHNHSLLLPEDYREEYLHHFRRALDGYHNDPWETCCLSREGNLRDVIMDLSPIRNDHGQTVGVSMIVRNIGEQKRAEALSREYLRDLEKTNRELDQFAYIVSHDLKAPLRAINSLSEWIEEDLGPQADPVVLERLGLLRKRIARLQDLINGILEYSRVGRKKREIQLIPVSMHVQEVLEGLPPGPGMRIRVEPSLPTIQADRTQLYQVFSNLISNAIKYHDKIDGNIWISCRDRGEMWEFSVKDDGPGIAPEYHSKIFGVFQRLESRDEVEGTGIGLSIVKKIIEDNGGTISLISKPGSGADFRFTWPKKLVG